MLDPVAERLSPEAAKSIIQLRADAVAQQQMDDLADKCTEGRLTADERADYEAYVAASGMIAVLQAKAKKVLSRGHAV